MSFAGSPSIAQVASPDNDGVYVDESGILRWKSSHAEVSLFGVNYTTPFAYGYRAHNKLGLSLKKAIDLDVAQFARLGLDAFRLHVWDKEISDRNGNVLQNEHLDLFDYLLARLADHGVKIILTPIAWWGNGWPEPDEKTAGFSQNYTKPELVTNDKAKVAQENYLRQFINHTNPYRKYSYKTDPSIIAVEIINEPHHPDDVNTVTAYINEMADVLRKAGLTKPIFYNISENWSKEQANAVARARIDGVSFQWYPTSLGHNKMLRGNYLANVNEYKIPSDDVAGYERKAKMVYEFETADVGDSYLYPAMARSFRKSGMQFATMFAYDPTQLAWSNTEYPTHYLNLLYTPSKALSLMIAAKAFRQIPLRASFGSYPENNRFGDVRVDYEKNLSEFNDEADFIYTNNTETCPKNPAALAHIAGCGNSSLVKYNGTGAYFLDKLSEGMWRLEVYPDVLWLRDPFVTTSLSRQAARLFWNERKIELSLPDLPSGYELFSKMQVVRAHETEAPVDRRVMPGIYIVAAKGIPKEKIQKYVSEKEEFLDGLYTPSATEPGLYVVNTTQMYAAESTKVRFSFQVAGERKISSVNLYTRRPGWRGFAKFALNDVSGFAYEITDTAAVFSSGVLEYCVAVSTGDSSVIFPGGTRGVPGSWDFSPDNVWTLKVVAPHEPIVILDASRDSRDFVFPHFSPSLRYFTDYKNGLNSENVALSVRGSFSDSTSIPFGFQFALSDVVRPLVPCLDEYSRVVVTARSTRDSATTISLIFMTNDGQNYKTEIDIGKEWKGIEIPLTAFHPGTALILPDSYPRFLPKLWKGIDTAKHSALKLRDAHTIQILVDGSSLRPGTQGKEFGFEVQSVVLKK